MNTKVCYHCKQKLPADEKHFDKDKKSKDGLTGKCKQCCKEYNIKRYFNKKDKIKNQTRRYYENNKEYIKKELFVINNKNCYERNKDKLKDIRREYREQHQEYYKNYFKENRDKTKKYREKRKYLEDKNESNLTNQQWIYIKSQFNNCCCYCGKTEQEEIKINKVHLSKDHFISVGNGGGYTISNIVPSCKNCNSSKHEQDFFKWYPKQEFFSEIREKNILDHLINIEEKWESYIKENKTDKEIK